MTPTFTDQVEQEAKKYVADNLKGGFVATLGKIQDIAQYSFIAGSTCSAVEQDKIRFAIEQLSSTISDDWFGMKDNVIIKIRELKSQLP